MAQPRSAAFAASVALGDHFRLSNTLLSTRRGSPVRTARRSCAASRLRMDAGPAAAGRVEGAFDYVIVGGGAAGCVLANRLSENGKASVLMLEAGRGPSEFTQHVPLGFPYLLGSSADWAYVTQPEPELNDRRLYFPRGRVLGGSHAISVMLYHRGSAADYDQNWPTGWHASDVLPYFVKSESQRSERLESSASHGTSGPLSVSDLATTNPMTSVFLRAAKSAGIPENSDFNDWSRPQDGVGCFQVTQRDGVRVSPATAYLDPAAARRNLTVRSRVHVERVHFSDPAGETDGLPRAVSVTYVDENSVRHTVSANREVLMTAGVYSSPQLLMLSGVGPAEQLRQHGINVVANVPEVGENLQDHAAVMLSYKSQNPVKDKSQSTVYYTEKTGKSPLAILNYLFRGKGPLTSPMCEAGGFVTTSPEYDSPDLQLRFIPFFSDPDPYESLSDFAQGGGYLKNRSDRPAGFTLQSVVARPRSRGSVGLVSADARDRVSIAANWMSDRADMATLVAGLKLSRAVAKQQQFSNYRGTEAYPGADKVSDSDLESYIRDSCHTANAMVGTCRMGVDHDSVVDTELRVRGVTGLRVVDSSVMPTLPGGQSGAPTMMIAERAADLIKQAV